MTACGPLLHVLPFALSARELRISPAGALSSSCSAHSLSACLARASSGVLRPKWSGIASTPVGLLAKDQRVNP